MTAGDIETPDSAASRRKQITSHLNESEPDQSGFRTDRFKTPSRDDFGTMKQLKNAPRVSSLKRYSNRAALAQDHRQRLS